MPFINRTTFSRVSHIAFSVRDLMTTVGWYRDVFGLSELDYTEGEGWRAVVMIHDTSDTIVEFRQYDANPGDTFDPCRTGLDRLTFEVDSRVSLDAWEENFIRLIVEHTPIIDREDGAVITFLDPDGIRMEMLFRATRP
jgi:glyoxylase I family protein